MFNLVCVGIFKLTLKLMISKERHFVLVSETSNYSSFHPFNQSIEAKPFIINKITELQDNIKWGSAFHWNRPRFKYRKIQ